MDIDVAVDDVAVDDVSVVSVFRAVAMIGVELD